VVGAAVLYHRRELERAAFDFTSVRTMKVTGMDRRCLMIRLIAPVVIACVILASTTMSARAQVIRTRGVAVDLVTCPRDATAPCLFLTAGVDDDGNGSASAIFFDPLSGVILWNQFATLRPGDLIVNGKATKATLRFPGAALNWTSLGRLTIERESEDVTILDGLKTKSSTRSLENAASVKGLLNDLVVDTLALPDQVLGETRIQRHSESTKSRDPED
jgi:hypothetical protein